MKSIDALILDLESTDSSVRDRAAISLMDIGDERAVLPLIKAIQMPENTNHRGTLVYALSAFNCLAHIKLLVNLILTANFEVATGSFQILEQSNLNKDQKNQIKKQISSIDPALIKQEHNNDGYQYLVELIQKRQGITKQFN